MGQVAEEPAESLHGTEDETIITPPADGLLAEAEVPSAEHTHAQGLTIYDLLLLAMVSTWAANPAAIKWALQYMDPLVFNSLRFALATLLPVTLVLISKEKLWPLPGDGRRILLLGLIGHGLYQTIFILALDRTLAGNVALILSTSPVFVAVFSALFGYETIRAYGWAGVGLSLTGVLLVILGSGEELSFGPRLVGDLMMLGVTMLWGLYTVMSQPLLHRYSSVKLNALAMPIGAIVLLVVSTPTIVSTAPRWTAAPPAVWLVLALSGLLAVSASYIIWYKGIQKLGSSRTAVYANLVPVLAALISSFFLHEALGWQFWAGMLLVLAGVTLARFGGRVLGGSR